MAENEIWQEMEKYDVTNTSTCIHVCTCAESILIPYQHVVHVLILFLQLLVHYAHDSSCAHDIHVHIHVITMVAAVTLKVETKLKEVSITMGYQATCA